MTKSSNKYLIIRRIVQFSILLLFIAGNIFSIKILTGNLSTAHVFDSFYLSDPYAVLQIMFSGFIVGTDALIGALIVFLFYVLIGGRSFCSWVCPINIISDIALWLRKIFKIESNYININRKTRYLLLFLGLLLSAITSVAAFEIINPISIIYRSIIFGLGFGWAIAFLILFFDLFVMKYGWCGHLCPLGGFYSLISKIHLIKVYHNEDNCTNCGKCFIVCPEVQVMDIIGVKSGFISSGECTNCGRCIEKCNDNALKFSINKFSYK